MSSGICSLNFEPTYLLTGVRCTSCGVLRISSDVCMYVGRIESRRVHPRLIAVSTYHDIINKHPILLWIDKHPIRIIGEI